MSDPLHLAQFEPHVGSTFTVADGALDLILTEAVAVPWRALGGPPPARAPFSLVFQGPRSPRLAQGLHTLSHPDLGAHLLFLVPIAADATTTSYEAAFN